MKKRRKSGQRHEHKLGSGPPGAPNANGVRRFWRPVIGILGVAVTGLLTFVVTGKLRHSSDSAMSLPGASSPAVITTHLASERPSNSVATPPTGGDTDAAAAALNARGNEQLEAGNVVGAIQLYREALALTPSDEDFHLNLGIAYAKQGDLARAEAEYREALRLLPDYPEAHNSLGNLLLRSGKLAEAEREFVEAISSFPEYAQAHNNLGIVLQRQNRNQDALASFQKAVEYETNYWEAHFNLAGAYFQVKNSEKAVAELRETLRINPGFEPARRLLSQVPSLGSNAPAVPQAPPPNPGMPR